MRTENERLEERLESLQAKHQTFQDRIVEASKQRRELQKELDDSKAAQRETVKYEADQLALDDSQSVKGYIQKVLQVKASSGSARQLQDNIDKLLFSEERCRERQREISKEIKEVKKQLKKIKDVELIQKTYDAYLGWFDSVQKNESSWFNFKDFVRQCHSEGMFYEGVIRDAGIEEPIFHELLQSRLRPPVLAQKRQRDLIDSLARIKMIDNNRWYTHPSRGDERRIGEKVKYDPRRSNFK